MKRSLKQPSIVDSMKKLQNKTERKKLLLNSPVIVIDDDDDDDFQPNGGRDENRAKQAKRKLNFSSAASIEKVGSKRKIRDKNKNIPIASSTPNKVSKELLNGDVSECPLQSSIITVSDKSLCSSLDDEDAKQKSPDKSKDIPIASFTPKRISIDSLNEDVSDSTLHSNLALTNKSLCSSSDSESTIILTQDYIEESLISCVLENPTDIDYIFGLEDNDNTIISSNKHKTETENKTKIVELNTSENSKLAKREVNKENRSETPNEKSVKKMEEKGIRNSSYSPSTFTLKQRTDSENSDDISMLCPGITTPKKKNASPRKADFGIMSPPVTPQKTVSPSKMSPKTSPNTGSPDANRKKERGLNGAILALITKLFMSVNESTHVRCLLDKEIAILFDFLQADPKYKYTCLKLYTYKLKWYNSYKFCEKIKLGVSSDEINEMYKFLSDKGIIETDYGNEDLSYLLNLLHVPDLKQILERFKLKRPTKGKHKSISRDESIQLTGKEDMIQLLLRNCRTQSTLSFARTTRDLLLEDIKTRLGLCFKLTETFREAFYKIYLLGTYTNLQFNNMSDFFHIMLDTTITFPEYDVEEYEVFKSKEEFQSYAKAKKLNDDFENAMTEKRFLDCLEISKEIFEKIQELADEKLPEDRYVHVPHLKRFRAISVYVSTLNRAIKHLQAKYPVDAKVWLEFLIDKINFPHRIGDWYYHLIWLHMRHLKPINNEHAADLLSEVLINHRIHLTDRQLYSLQEKGEQLKLCKKNRINESCLKKFSHLLPEPIEAEHFPITVIDARTIRSNDAGRKRSYVMQDDEGSKTYMNVETIALSHYTDSGQYTDGKHCEGSLIKALFTIYFWDLIYSPTKKVPATFLSKYQVVPLDMYTQHFYLNRKESVDQRLEDIEVEWSDEKLLVFARNQWLLHSKERGFYDVGLIETEEFLCLLIECIGRTLLSGIFRRLVKDVRQYSSGMPDLLIWNDKQKLVKFVEVKGENDRLSITQKLWIKYLLSIGADAEVCHVHSTGSKRKFTNKMLQKSVSEDSIVSSDVTK